MGSEEVLIAVNPHNTLVVLGSLRCRTLVEAEFANTHAGYREMVRFARRWAGTMGQAHPKAYSHTPQERLRMASAWWNGGKQRAIGTRSFRRGSRRRSRRSAIFLSLR